MSWDARKMSEKYFDNKVKLKRTMNNARKLPVRHDDSKLLWNPIDIEWTLEIQQVMTDHNQNNYRFILCPVTNLDNLIVKPLMIHKNSPIRWMYSTELVGKS